MNIKALCNQLFIQFNTLPRATWSSPNCPFDHIKATLIIMLTVTCSACANTHYGYSEQEWKTLSEDEKQSAKAEYQQVIDVKNSQQHEDLINERRQQVINRGIGTQ